MSFCYLTQQGQEVILFHEKTIVHHIKVPLLIWIVLAFKLDVVNILLLQLFRSHKNECKLLWDMLYTFK